MKIFVRPTTITLDWIVLVDDVHLIVVDVDLLVVVAEFVVIGRR